MVVSTETSTFSLNWLSGRNVYVPAALFPARLSLRLQLCLCSMFSFLSLIFFFFFIWRLMLTLLNPGLKIHLFTEQICKTFCDVTVTPRERRSRIWRFCNFTDFQVKLFWSYLSYVMKDKLNFTIYFEKKSLEESSKQRSTTRRRLARS